jgi:hypothetical protein
VGEFRIGAPGAGRIGRSLSIAVLALFPAACIEQEGCRVPKPYRTAFFCSETSSRYPIRDSEAGRAFWQERDRQQAPQNANPPTTEADRRREQAEREGWQRSAEQCAKDGKRFTGKQCR